MTKSEAMSGHLCAADIQNLVQYDPTTGRLIRVSNGRFADSVISAQGYRTVSLQGKRYLAHRVVWALFNGAWPEKGKVVDHRDTNSLNNRVGNLRVVSYGVNLRNLKGSKKRPSGICLPLGVVLHGPSFRAQIRINRKYYNLGSYSTPEQAHAVYLSAVKAAERGITPKADHD